jgi:outer membrane receptor for ferrienterochelin and colicin
VNIRNMNFYEINRTLKIEAGFDAEYSPTEYDYVLAEYRDRLGNAVPAEYIVNHLTTTQVGVYVNTIWNPFERLTVTAGLRRDYFSFNDHANISPRILVSYRLNERLALSASAGLFTQHLPSVLLMQNEAYKNLSDPEAVHYVLGLDYMLTSDTKLTFELYDKEYRNLPLNPSDPTLSLIDDGRSGSHFRNYSFIVSEGKAYTRGMEFLIQKKLAKDFYGLVSATLFRSRYCDYSGQWRDRLYDNRYLFSVIGGYKPNNTWEFSLRWTIAGGVPYTPFDIEQSTAANTGIIDKNRINGSRYPDYHSLNIRIDKRFFFQHSSLTLYLSILNAYGRENISNYSWDKVENMQRTSHQWGFLPIIGFEYEL